MTSTPHSTPDPGPDAALIGAMRRLLAVTFVVGVVGTTAELLLLEHTEDAAQWIPIALFAAGLLVLGWYAVARSRMSLRVFQLVMCSYIVGGFAGIALHYRGNVEFEREMTPSISGWPLFREAMTGATPALAPGTMVPLALVGLAFTLRHPVLRRTGGERSLPLES